MKAMENYFLLVLLGVAVLAGCKKDDDSNPPCCDPAILEFPNYDSALKSSVSVALTIYNDVFPVVQIV